MTLFSEKNVGLYQQHKLPGLQLRKIRHENSLLKSIAIYLQVKMEQLEGADGQLIISDNISDLMVKLKRSIIVVKDFYQVVNACDLDLFLAEPVIVYARGDGSYDAYTKKNPLQESRLIIQEIMEQYPGESSTSLFQTDTPPQP